GTLALSVRPAGDAAEIVVQDSGGPMDAANLEALFEPFSSGQPVGSGTSLILAEGRQRVSDWGGSLEARSSAQGLAFHLRLPLSVSSGEALDPVRAHKAAQLDEVPQRVLVVDDD